jgi:MinD-like ATPase involved in chromosome partitioning or flagellar assembly
VPDLDQTAFRAAVTNLFSSLKAGGQYDYVIVDTRGGFAFESTDVCALADSFIVVTEPDITSFYQDRNLVRRISDAAKQMNARPLLRSIIVNKASEGELKSENIELDKLEVSFRLELEKEFPLKFLDTHPVPVDIEALRAYKTQRIPYLAAPASLFAFSTLSAFRDILQVVTARWTDEQVKNWNELVDSVSQAIATRNQTIKAESNARAERDQQFVALQSENKNLQERLTDLKKEIDRLENRYERELQRTTAILNQQSPSPMIDIVVPPRKQPRANPTLSETGSFTIPLNVASSETGSPPVPFDGESSVPHSAGPFSWWKWTVGVVVLLLAIVLAIIVYRSRSHAPTITNANGPAVQDVPVIPTQPSGRIIVFFDNWNVEAVQNFPAVATRFRITQTFHIISIVDYHWNDGHGADPTGGYITLRLLNGGAKFPSWPVKGLDGQGGVPNATWACYPNVTVPPGLYEVVDSSPETWSQNDRSGNKGFSRITGYVPGPEQSQ